MTAPWLAGLFPAVSFEAVNLLSHACEGAAIAGRATIVSPAR